MTRPFPGRGKKPKGERDLTARHTLIQKPKGVMVHTPFGLEREPRRLSPYAKRALQDKNTVTARAQELYLNAKPSRLDTPQKTRNLDHVHELVRGPDGKLYRKQSQKRERRRLNPGTAGARLGSHKTVSGKARDLFQNLGITRRGLGTKRHAFNRKRLARNARKHRKD